MVSAVLVLQITGCGNSGAADHSAENTGVENTGTENTASPNIETTADENRIMMLFWSDFRQGLRTTI